MCYQCGKCEQEHNFDIDDAIDAVEAIGLHHK